MKTFLFGIAVGVLLKHMWDSGYGDEVRATARDWRNRVEDKVNDGIRQVTSTIEDTAASIDQGARKLIQ